MTTIPNPFPTSKKNSDIRFGTYNIQSGRNGRLETCLRAMGQMGLDWGILTETKQLCDNATRRSGDSSRLYWWTQQTLELDEEAQAAVVSDQESDGEQE